MTIYNFGLWLLMVTAVTKGDSRTLSAACSSSHWHERGSVATRNSIEDKIHHDSLSVFSQDLSSRTAWEGGRVRPWSRKTDSRSEEEEEEGRSIKQDIVNEDGKGVAQFTLSLISQASKTLQLYLVQFINWPCGCL